ncbi:MAG: alpha/beta hydrolase [Candidatus Levybacteria bacterium]|nr:alpha/beta hydrolase [Candidatus Levybacteria bacterium]
MDINHNSETESVAFQEFNSAERGAKKSVEVNGKKWEYLEYGNPDGIPILNVHGWLGASAEGNELLSKALTGEVQNSVGLQNLEENVPKGAQKVKDLVGEIKGKYRIIAPQLPGFGKSEAIDDPTLDNMADELSVFSQAVDMDKPVVFGSSMGGILGIKLAARHPDALRALIIQGTMTQPTDMNSREYILSRVATFPPIKMAVENIPFLANFAKERLFKPGIQGNKDFKLATPENQELMLRDVGNTDPKTALSTLRGIGSHLEGDIDRVTVPVVVLDGTAGDLVPIVKSKDIAGRFHRQDEDNRENLRKNIIDRRTMYFQIGGVAGEHGHSVINSAPEEVAVLINHAVSNYFKV